jgi:hypothetical protein
MKCLLVLATLLAPISSWAQYPPIQINIYFELTSPVSFYRHLADSAHQPLAVQWLHGQAFKVAGRAGPHWFAVLPMTTVDTTTFYVKAPTLKGKVKEAYPESKQLLIE